MVLDNSKIEELTKKHITAYRERMDIAYNAFREKYEAMHYSNVAFHQKIPNDILSSSTRQSSDQNSNKFLMPWHAIVVKQLKKELTVNMPSFDIKGNNDIGKAIVDEFDSKIAEIFSYQKFGFKIKFGYDYGLVKGTMVQETVYSRMVERFLDEAGEEDSVDMGGNIDFMFYDPLLVAPDPNASPADFSNTAKWCIVTKGFYSPEEIELMYGIKVQGRSSGGASVDTDLMSFEAKQLSGFDPSAANMVPVRYYYLTDGYVYTVVGDSYVVSRRVNAIRVVGKIPLNFSPLIPDPDCIFGFTLWEIIRYCVAMASKAMNQIADNNEFNNEFPMVVMRGTNIELMQLGDDNDGVKYIEINPIGERTSIQDLVYKFSFPEVTAGAQALLEISGQMINLLTGVTSASMGVQSKQMRTSTEASIYQQAILTNSSEMVINVETAMINPMVWDVLRIFSRYHADFNFKEITPDFLKNFKNVHVSNGSMLGQDKIRKIDFLNYLMTRAQANPLLFDQMKVEKFGLKAFGEPNPDSWFRSEEEMMAQQESMQQEQMARAKKAGLGNGQQ